MFDICSNSIHAKAARFLLFICFAIAVVATLTTRKVDAIRANSVNSTTQEFSTTLPTKGKVNGKIVFTSDRKGPGLKLWSMNPDGSNPVQLTDESGRGPNLPSYVHVWDGPAKWSPDGSKIAFRSIRNGDAAESHSLYVMNADGTNVQRIVIDLTGIKEAPQILSFEWSLDGTRFLFEAGNDGCPTEGDCWLNTNIFTATTDGKNLVRLTNDDTVLNSSATLSPGGDRVVFTSGGLGQRSIHVINADGSNRRAVANGYYPSWSPDGSKILFIQGGQVYTVNPDGSNLNQLTNYAASYGTYSGPKYSPAGTKIVFEREFANGDSGVFVMDANGNNQINISNSSSDDAQPDWQPLLAPTNDPPPSVLGFDTRVYLATYPNPSTVQINLTRSGNLDQTVSCDYQIRSGPITAGLPGGTLSFAPGETSKTIQFSYSYGYAFNISLFNNAGNATFLGGIKDATIIFLYQTNNPIDNSGFFVRQQYYDFLNREPDTWGWNFWTSNIDSCGSSDPTRPACITKRTDTSAAFFLSMEFQQTGYLVYRIYKAAYGNLPVAPVPIHLSDFLTDTREVGQGVVVGQAGWEQTLETNKQKFFASFVQRSQFTLAYPTFMTPVQFVDALFANAGAIPSVSERESAIGEFNSATGSADNAARARALRRVAENSTLAQQEFNRAFVLMEYFGYLRRNPNEGPDTDYSGYEFWLQKLNQFNGDYQKSEMVKAFINSTEYRKRFGP